ncbi:unnamed protein product [Clavelina lepadiformis]|uniref:Rabphilin n=1 Tax=Clavelina lepadiformis TaxID=159417 RepID=A0ABP0GWS7_CLALP
MLSQNGQNNLWVCPSDRHLMLRSKLDAGWSVRGIQPDKKQHSHSVSPEEMVHIKRVIARAENIDVSEQKRIGSMVQQLESMRKIARGDGVTRCILCSEEFRKFVGASPLICMDCKKKMCQKCCVDFSTVSTLQNVQRKHSNKASKSTTWLCKICCESREVWKRSGAWFFRGLPKYILPEQNPVIVASRYDVRPSNNVYVYPPSEDANPHKPAFGQQSSSRTYSHYKSIGRRRSSSSESSDNDGSVIERRRSRNASSSSSAISNASSPSLAVSYGAMSLSSSTNFGEDYRLTSAFSRHGSNNSNPSLGVSPQRRRVSGRRKKLKKTAMEEENLPKNDVTEESSSTIPPTKDSLDMSSLHSSGVKQTNDDSASSPHIGGSYIERVYTDVDNAGPLGSVEFTALHDPIKLALHVTVIRARNLKAMDLNGFSDPYVKLHLLPGSKKSSKMRTRTKFKTLNPNFDETLTYWGITESDMSKRKLRLMVLDEDRFGHNDFIGEVTVTLRHLTPLETKIFNMALDYHHTLKKSDEEDDNERGRLLFSLQFQEDDSTLLVNIARCAGLVPVARNNAIDPQVKVCLQLDEPGSNEVMCEKTERKKSTRNTNPAFQTSVKLPIIGGGNNLVKCRLDISVWDKDSFGREHLVGALELGIKSKGNELRHWFDCVKHPGNIVEMWHNLTFPPDPERISALASAGKRRRTPRLPRKFVS